VLDAAGKQSFTRSLVFSQRISFFPGPKRHHTRTTWCYFESAQ
jgi:hypothetical protein